MNSCESIQVYQISSGNSELCLHVVFNLRKPDYSNSAFGCLYSHEQKHYVEQPGFMEQFYDLPPTRIKKTVSTQLTVLGEIGERSVYT